ncbi:cytochrome c3-like protein [Prosthecobacter fusiformis]|uniref:nitrite reductase (cytochrome; ammonia-forming) n=1 Tax=Prosthecobacter fusiformis TaxID=48464 RepID=A0A4R7S837_9BACT|nr:cytochrome c3 family protein [Prosthecobacter fusiformis]TDU73437.1 cytochrome c3-like protein [Prosthecobacter fusiformis]
MNTSASILPWVLGIGSAAVLSSYLAGRFREDDGASTVFLPGPTTHGHYQIEMKCSACHEPWGAVREQSCLDCHGGALTAAKDSHSMAKFADPRNADRLSTIAADKCITCHIEHRPEATSQMGLTQPMDYCLHCHADVAKERPTHEGLSFTTCTNVGCHNYHDNTALYEDFLAKHASGPAQLLNAILPQRTPSPNASIAASATVALSSAQHDGHLPVSSPAASRILNEWAASAHAASAVNCTACHGTKNSWQDSPGMDSCTHCHKQENEGFLAGLHGMRVAQGLPPMQPGQARLPMQEKSAHLSLTCTSCHTPHDSDTRRAAVESCLQCHADNHSLAYKNSSHYQLWMAEISGKAPAGSGVSCATCHMPRETHARGGLTTVSVQHNQSMNLRPVEKMARGVCMNCHGLGFTMDSLADPKLGPSNFDGHPEHHIESIEMVLSRRKSSVKKQ